MSFLYPLLWLGAAGVVVPVWLHLRMKQSRVVRFSTLRFLQDLKTPQPSSGRPRDLPLLIARLLALILLVAAFTRPYRAETKPARITVSRVHVLDGTLSHQVGNGFARDRDRIRERLRQAGAETQDAVVVLGARPRVAVGFSDGPAERESKLSALAPSFERGSYLEAVRSARSLLDSSLGETREILVYGDHQENQWAENENSPPFLKAVDLRMESPPVELEKPNLSIGGPSARLFFVGDRTFVEFKAELRHQGQGPNARATVVVEANGKNVLKETVALPSVELLTLRAEWQSDPRVWLKGTIRVEGKTDVLAADNTSYFCLPPLREGRVAFLGRSHYLKAALAPETMRGRWSTRLLDPALRGADAESDLADVLIVEGDYAQSEAVRQLVFRYLNNERGVWVIVSRVTPLLRGFFAELGFDVDRKARVSESSSPFWYVATRHPIFSPFVKGELGNLMDVRVSRHVALRPRVAFPLLAGPSGEGFLFDAPQPRGRLVVAGFAFDREHTNWPVQPSFIPFVDLTLQHLRAASEVETSALPGDLYIHRVPTDRSAREVLLRSEKGILTRSAVDEARIARLPTPASPGLYTLTYDADPSAIGMIAVNPSPKESVLKYVAQPKALAAWKVPEERTAAKSPEGPRAPAKPPSVSANRGARSWWWLLVSASLALGVETTFLMFQRERA